MFVDHVWRVSGVKLRGSFPRLCAFSSYFSPWVLTSWHGKSEIISCEWRDSSKRSAIRTIVHCVSSLVRPQPEMEDDAPCALCWPPTSENWVKFSSLNLGICCLPYLVKISGCYHVLRLLNNLPFSRVLGPNPLSLAPDPFATIRLPYCLQSFSTKTI